MRHVRAHQERVARRALSQTLGSRVAAQPVDRATHGVSHDGAARARRAVAPHLLVVEERDHAHAGLIRQAPAVAGVQQRLERAEGRGEVIQPAAVDELARRSADDARLRVANLQLEVDDLARVAVQLLGENGEQQRVVRGLLLFRILCFFTTTRLRLELALDGGAQQRREVRFGVGLEPLRVDVAVEVDGERRDADDGALHAHQLVARPAFVLPAPQEHAPGDGQVAVEPGVPQPAAVGLHADAQESSFLHR